jgi:hypothetical protein
MKKKINDKEREKKMFPITVLQLITIHLPFLFVENIKIF